jgi:uncharacterized protein with HEPN domain
LSRYEPRVPGFYRGYFRWDDQGRDAARGVSYAQFEADFRINFAVVRALEIIGEAVKRLPEGLYQRYPDIPWRGMAGMRDRIIHGYDNVDLQIVWDVVKRDIPQIKPKIEQILEDYVDYG